MARKADDIKKELARRSLERKESASKPDVVENGEVEELETEMLTDMEEVLEEGEEDYEDIGDFDALIDLAHEEGYGAYYEGQEVTSNPYTMFEDEDADAHNLYVAAWEEGWVDAHREGCLTDVVVAAYKLVKAGTEEEATKMFSHLEESLTALGEVSNLDELEESWGE
jgi:hypothetical protein